MYLFIYNTLHVLYGSFLDIDTHACASCQSVCILLLVSIDKQSILDHKFCVRDVLQCASNFLLTSVCPVYQMIVISLI